MDIFISYRIEDIEFTRRLKAELQQRLVCNVYIAPDDVDEADFGDWIKRKIKGCDVYILVVTKNTFAAKIFDDDDWVRQEIRIALTEKKKQSILTLVAGEVPPGNLPSDIEEIANIHGIEIFSRNFEADLERLIIQIKKYFPQAQRRVPPYLLTRNQASKYAEYADFIDKAQKTIHVYGAGLGVVGDYLDQYKEAIERGICLYFMHMDTDIVSDHTARFFGKDTREQICSEINGTLGLHLKPLSDFAKSIYPEDYYKRVMVHTRKTGPDIGVIACDLDEPHGFMRIEFYEPFMNSGKRLGLLLYANQEEELYRQRKQIIEKLWREENESVCAIIPDEDNKILLTKRLIDLFRGYWCLPGGHIDVGETREQAIIREVKEETGLDVEVEFFGRFREDFPDIGHHCWVNVYVGKPIGGSLKAQETEVEKIGWFSLDEACNMSLGFKHEKILQAYRQQL